MSTKTGWCMTGDCDTGGVRGGCPIQTGKNPACSCPCHEGAETPRDYLEERQRISRARADKETAEAASRSAGQDGT